MECSKIITESLSIAKIVHGFMSDMLNASSHSSKQRD